MKNLVCFDDAAFSFLLSPWTATKGAVSRVTIIKVLESFRWLGSTKLPLPLGHGRIDQSLCHQWRKRLPVETLCSLELEFQPSSMSDFSCVKHLLLSSS